MRAHRNLEVWKRGIELTRAVYRVTSQFPDTEQFGLTSQMRRAAVSIPSNIAEGAARTGKREFLRYISITHGSASELDTQLEVAKGLGYPSEKDYDGISGELNIISRQLYGLARALRTK